MAHVWAKQAGNWTDTTLWAFWNETTQQIEDYGQLPQDGDYVYANGYVISIGTYSPNNVTITNGYLSYTGNIDGYFNISSTTRTVSMSLISEYSSVLRIAGNTSGSILTIVGNITTTSSSFQCAIRRTVSGGNRCAVSVTGNIICNGTNGSGFFDATGSNYTNLSNDPFPIINGNVTIYDNNTFIKGYSNGINDLTLNGSITFGNNIIFERVNGFSCNNLIVNGILRTKTNIVVKSLNITGTIKYSTVNSIGILADSIVVGNPNTFLWSFDGEPNPNPYIIINPNTIAQTYPPENKVLAPTIYGSQMELTGTYTPDFPQEANVLQGVIYDNGNKTGTLAPVVLGDYPDVDKVLVGTIFDYGNKVGTLEPTADYPAEADVKEGVVYDYGQKEGTLSVSADYPPESVVMQGVEYAFGEMTGTMDVSVQVGCVTKEDVREGVALLGMGETGTLVVPSADDVREGVVFDNGTIGTLIVQGGGDRLRIADFSYYTNAQSDTYIVDITEADKPKFASAEERILIEMFPSLDLDNIPEMYFDDLFVKYLKYRLIVEYYRTAGVNSTFTPSEPTTEIVNYRNVTCEVWLNSANIYLNAWNKKYDLNKPPQKIRL